MISPSAPASERLAFALDVADLASARDWITRLSPHVRLFKVGLELFMRAGPEAVAAVHGAGARCFLDLKLHDIPETVGRAVSAAGSLGVELLTVHASGGRAMLTRAASAARESARPMHLLAVTMLTSLDDAASAEIGYGASTATMTERLAALADASGVGGIVCSAHEVARLKAGNPSLLAVTPGIRPRGSDAGDQARVATAGEAVRAGADILVVGRPIRDARDPVAVARELLAEIEGSFA